MSLPADLDPVRLAGAVRAAGGSWTAITAMSEVTSTNTLALVAGRTGAPTGTCFVADHQVAGRGRQARSWAAAPGTSAMFSIVLRPGHAAAAPGLLPLAVGVAVAEALEQATALPVRLKWPNDVLVPSAAGQLGKCAGLLAESDHSAGVVVVGIGINVSMAQSQLPVPTATSLMLAGAGGVSRGVLIGTALARIESAFGKWQEGQDAAILTRYRQLCATIGQDVTVDTPLGRLAGYCAGIGPGGELVLDITGERRLLVAGDVTHVRLRASGG